MKALWWVAGLLAAAAAGAAANTTQPLLFVSNRDGNAQIYLIQDDGSGERALTRGPAENTEPAWSPDGRRIAFTSYRDGNAEIYVMEADGSRQTRLTTDPASDNAAAWTADGRIVFRSMRDRWANFFVVDGDGRGLSRLTADESDKGAPLPSPDGRWIAYVAHGERGRTDIHVMPAAGGAAKNLTGALPSKPRSLSTWAPDGRRLAFVEANGSALDVVAVDPDGANPARITDNPYANASPVWSPDGRRFAFVSSREGSRSERARGDIYVMNADGSGATNLTRHPGEDNYPAWAADGETIYFVSLRDGNAQIHAVPARGGDTRRLTRSAGHDLMIRPLPASALTQPLAQAPAAGKDAR